MVVGAMYCLVLLCSLNEFGLDWIGLDWITSNPFGKPKKMLTKLGFGVGGGGNPAVD